MSRLPDHDFDTSARRAHAGALDALSPRVQAQLAQRRRAALSSVQSPAPRPWAWMTAAASAGVLVLVVALQIRPPLDSPAPADAALAAAAAPDATPDPVGALAEDPDFYLWLASNESQSIALE